MSKILVPLYPENSSFIFQYINSGADIFYLGFVSKDTSKTINRRPKFDVGEMDVSYNEPNYSNYLQLKDTLDVIHKNGKLAYLTLNEHYYSISDTDFILENLILWKKLFDGFIVCSPVFIRKMIENGVDNIIASVGTHVFNKYALQFYIELGIKTIVLPRAIRKEQVLEFASCYPEIEFEYLVFNDFCTYVDGLCRSLHSMPFNSVCHHVDIKTNTPPFKHFGCRICNLFHLLKRDNISYKIAGRGFEPENILKCVVLLNHLREKHPQFKDVYDFETYSKKKYYEIFGMDCLENCKKDD